MALRVAFLILALLAPTGLIVYKATRADPIAVNLYAERPKKPSGFWTGTRPAKGGAYRWRLLAIGAGLAVVTGAGMVYVVRRATSSSGSSDERSRARV